MYSRNFYNKNLKQTSRELRKNMTPAELKLWYQFLRRHTLRVHRQRSMSNFIVDFYIPKAKLIIEVDGEIHYEETHFSKDRDRDMFFLTQGIMTFRVRNEDVFEQFHQVCNDIDRIIFSRLRKE